MTLDFDSVAAASITRYIAHKRALGRRFETEAWNLRLLDRFLDARGVQSLPEISPAMVDAFLASRPRETPRSYNHLLGVVRGLFCWMVAREELICSPVRARPRRVTTGRLPFIFNAEQAARLLELANALPDSRSTHLRGATYRLAFALLYGLGLRVGEVRHLCIGDVDQQRGLLVIRETKFAKSRLVPHGPRMATQLRLYLNARADLTGELAPDAPVLSMFVEGPLGRGSIGRAFRTLLPKLGLDLKPGSSPPRVHDLRHSFAVGTLLRWYRAGIDPAHRLMQLSTFMGHVQPESTAVYLTITDELLTTANERFEAYAGLGWPVPPETRP
ncbi:MAG TPA: tyrosine-type recombinase/integrase [Myxococcota bacterium]|nr:tyrosine-type recombinase/integrase [Myxococcota bacterium]